MSCLTNCLHKQYFWTNDEFIEPNDNTNEALKLLMNV